MTDGSTSAPGDRLAKVIARAGLCSRRDAEDWIRAGRVVVNGKKIISPAFNVVESDDISVDGAQLAARAGTRVWLYHKPKGLVVTEKDPEGRTTVFETLEREGLPRVMSVGRLDINTEGLLLLTNDGGLKRVLELPATGWLRKYRVRAHGTVTQAQLDSLKTGLEHDGVKYGPIEATLERQQGANVWLELALREGKNREVKNVLMALGLEVNRLIRVSFGPFQLGDLPVGGIEVVKARVLKDQLGKRLAEKAEADFESEMPEAVAAETRRGAAPTERQAGRGTHTTTIAQQRFRFTDRAEMPPEAAAQRRQERGASSRGAPPSAPHGAGLPAGRFASDRGRGDADEAPARHIHFDDGREPPVFEEKTYGKKPRPGPGDKPSGPHVFGKPNQRGASRNARRADAAPRPARAFDDKPRRPRADGDASRPARSFKPRAEGSGDARPPRNFGDKPRGASSFAGKPARSRPEGDAARPARAYSPRTEGDARPARSFKPRADGDAARPARVYKPRPPGDKPRAAAGDARPPRAFKPRADGDAPRPARAYKPRAEAAGGAETRLARKPGAVKKPFRPRGDAPGGARPTGGKPPGKGGRPPSGPREK
jgi:23S rRNA pseudouridine2605 synthase